MTHSHYWYQLHPEDEPKPPFNWGVVIAILFMIGLIILCGVMK